VPNRSSCRDGGQFDDRIIAQRRDCFQAHVAAALNCPFIVLFEQQRANEARDRIFVGEDADDIGAPLDLTLSATSSSASAYTSVTLSRRAMAT
jgi:hypothetical protein